MLAPIILFVYNRPEHTKKTIEALKKNELASESVLYVFSDGAKDDATEEQKNKILDIRNYIHTITGFKELTIEEAPKNKGLANSVIYGVTKVINTHGKAIVVEDDIVTHPFFLRFMNECLDKYEDREDIFMVGGYNQRFKFPWWYRKDIYLAHRVCSWGWATWKSRWDMADWSVEDFPLMCKNSKAQLIFNRGGDDLFPMLKSQMEGKIDSWAIRWEYSLYKFNAVCIRPRYTLVLNCGFDGSGVHCGKVRDKYSADMYNRKKYCISLPINIRTHKAIEIVFRNTISPVETTQNFSFMYKVRRKLNELGLYKYCRILKHLFLD